MGTDQALNLALLPILIIIILISLLNGNLSINEAVDALLNEPPL